MCCFNKRIVIKEIFKYFFRNIEMILKWDMDIFEWILEKQIYNNFKQILILKIIVIFGRLYVELKQICVKLFKIVVYNSFKQRIN